MTSTYTDRIQGVQTSVAIKAPVRVATTANITLSGLQDIDGVTVAAGDRVLVKNQTNGVENGIYVVSADAWTRAIDWDGARDIVKGTRVYSVEGTTNTARVFVVSTSDPVIGTSSVSLSSDEAELQEDIIPGDVYVSLVLGQSNARGVPEATGGNQTTSQFVRIWDSSATTPTYVQGTQFRTAAFGTAPLNIGSTGAWSNNLGFHFARAVYERTRRVQYQIQVAVAAHSVEAFISDADLSANGWTRPGGDGDLNTAMLTALGNALPQIPGTPTRLDAVIIHQGEANDSDQVEVFADKWGVVLQDLTDRGYIDDRTVIVMGELAQVQTNYVRRHLNALYRLQMDWPRLKVARSTGLPSYTAGNVHFSGASLAKYGRRYADAAFSEQNFAKSESIGADLSVEAGLAWATDIGVNLTDFSDASRTPRSFSTSPAITEDADLGWCYVGAANDQLNLPSRRIYRVPESGVFRMTYEIKVLDNPGSVDARVTVYEWDVDRVSLGPNGYAAAVSPVDYADGRVIVSETFGRAGSGADHEFSATAMWFNPAFIAGFGNDDESYVFNVLSFEFEDAQHVTGVWTPVLSDAETGGNLASLGTATGRYTKIGNIVHFEFEVTNITTTGMTGANALYIRGLPYTVENLATSAAPCAATVSNVTFTTPPAISPRNNSTTLRLRQSISGSAAVFITVSQLTSGTASIWGRGSYRVA